ncbi:unnamed protein product, partial [Hapterophycus canaliculatus]
LRFWGKIATRGDDYVVVEGKAIDETLGEFDDALQEGKDGGNRYTYWRYFTGNFESPVPGYPPFPGTEVHLLRAQIARITAGTCVSPAGFFEVDEEAE